MKKMFLTTLTAMSLVGTSTMAAAATAAPTSPATVQTPLTQPANETVQGDSQLAGGPGLIVLILAIVAIGLGVAAATSNSGSHPTSP